METINIKFGGLSNSPSDEMTSDHAIAASLGLVAQGDELIPVADPSVILSNLSENRKMEYIHTTAGKETYIISDTTNVCKLYATDKTGVIDSEATPFLTIDGLKRITSIGHILLVLDTNGDTHYVLWRNGKYIDLGTELPQLEVRSSLDTTIFDPTRMLSKFGNIYEIDSDVVISSADDKDKLLSQEICRKLYSGEYSRIKLTGDAKINIGQKAIGLIEQYRNTLHKEGLFTEPFYVRYAYRLYTGDPTIGDYIKHTPPILMVPNSSGKPLACVEINSIGEAKLKPIVTGAKLNYEIAPQDLEKWSNIIQSIDVFVTPAITDYTSDVEGVNALKVMSGHYYTKDKEGKTEWKVNDSYYPYIMTKNGLWENLYKKSLEQKKPYALESFSKKANEQFYAPFKEEDYMHVAIEVSNVQDLVLNEYWNSIGEGDDGEALRPPINKGLEVKSEEDNEFGLPEGVYNIYRLYKDEYYGEPRNFVYAFNKSVEGYAIYGPNKSYNVLTNSHFLLDIERTSENYDEELVEYSNFYKVAEIPIGSIKTGIQTLELEKNALLNLETRDELPDAGQGHTQNKIKEIVAYNSRLSSIVTKETAKPFTSVTEQNPHIFSAASTKTIEKGYVEITENGQTTYVELKGEELNASDARVFTYPNINATKLILFEKGSKDIFDDKYWYSKIEIPLKKHRFLNAAYAFNRFGSIISLKLSDTRTKDTTLPTEGITYTNKIITSSTNNPFHFPENLACIVPTDKVDTICATTKALSEGQFGQFPLYAFTNDGVWALSVSSEGKYIAQQAATRDVCNNLYSITQSDNALYFTSDRGVIILAGSESLCISDILNDNGDIFDIKALPHWEELTQLCDATEDETCYIPFLDYIKDASLAYDYIHQRLYIYNPTMKYAYLYSLTFKKWTITRNNIASKVNSYPDALVNTKDHKFVNLCKDSEHIQKQFLVTRPIKLSSPNTLKRIRTVIVHGNFAKGHVACALYGSRDMQSWHLIASRQTHEIRNICGTPYKYFRLVVLPNLAKGETLSYATLEYEPIFNNKLR